MSEGAIDPQATVSVEIDGRTLSGVGVDAERLQETIDRRTTVESGAESVPAAAAPDPRVAPADSAQPKPTRGQARFSELTQARKEAEARAEAIQREFEEYKARVAPPPARADQPQGAAAPQAAGADASRQAVASSSTRPEPTEDEVGTKYATYGDFVKDHGTWVWEQQQTHIADLVRQQLASDRAVQQRQTLAESTWAKGRAAYKDFDTVMASGSVPLPWEAIDLIYQHPQSEHLQYAILKDRATAQRLAWIATNQPYAFGLELQKLAPAAPAASPASTGTPVSATPPPPMQPVGSGSKTTSPSSADAARLGDYDAYKARRAAERGGRRR